MFINSIIQYLPSWNISFLKFLFKFYRTLLFKSGIISFDNIKNQSLKQIITEFNLKRPLGPQKKICLAPFTSLYFGPGGDVTPCCFNRLYHLGRFPDQSISEIWNGNKITNLKGALTQYDFSYGCSMCEETLHAKNFSGVGAVTYDMALINKKYPTILKFELSNTCNLACIMCNEKYSSSFEKNKSKKINYYDDTFLSELSEFIPKINDASFLGGEPFLINIYYKIWDLILQMNPSCIINLQTNGTILNEKIKSLLARGNFHISVSVDSLDKITYENIRKNASFDEMLTNLKYFSEYAKKKKAYFGISFCPMQINWNEIPELIDFCNKHRAKLFFNYVVSPAILTLKTLDPDQLKKIQLFLENSNIKNETSIEKYNYNQYISLLNQIRSWYQENRKYEEAFNKVRDNNIVELLDNFIFKTETYIKSETSLNGETGRNIVNRLNVLKEKLIPGLENTEFAKRKIFHLINIPGKNIIKGLDMKSDEEIIIEIT